MSAPALGPLLVGLVQTMAAITAPAKPEQYDPAAKAGEKPQPLTRDDVSRALVNAETCVDDLVKQLAAGGYFGAERAEALASWQRCAAALREELRRMPCPPSPYIAALREGR